jgi:prepilin-type N-terminal cleavage/methylation domain-containing protein
MIKMKNEQDGFSLIELIMVVTILGILSSISVPMLIKARETAENSSAYSAMRNLSTLQVSYYSRNNRFAKLDELLADQKGLGTFADDTLTRGKYTFVMHPLHPSPEELAKEYKIIATSPSAGRPEPYVLEVDQTGVIKDPYKAE